MVPYNFNKKMPFARDRFYLSSY